MAVPTWINNVVRVAFPVGDRPQPRLDDCPDERADTVIIGEVWYTAQTISKWRNEYGDVTARAMIADAMDKAGLK